MQQVAAGLGIGALMFLCVEFIGLEKTNKRLESELNSIRQQEAMCRVELDAHKSHMRLTTE
jgi:hypothetical protein